MNASSAFETVETIPNTESNEGSNTVDEHGVKYRTIDSSGSTALTLGILGIIFIFIVSLVGLILCIIAVVKGSKGIKILAPEDRGQAIAGLVLGIIWLVIWAVSLAVGGLAVSMLF